MTTPSMDDKSIPSPPTRDHAKYQADKQNGVEPVGHPRDAKTATEEGPTSDRGSGKDQQGLQVA